MRQRDRLGFACLWTALWLSLELGKFAYKEGVRDGRAAAWGEALDMIGDHRTRYDLKRVSAHEERRRRAQRA